MNNKKTLFMSLVIVLLVGLMVSAGTFAYFQWTTDVSQRTNVNVTIEGDQMTMYMTPEETVFSGLMPTGDCERDAAYSDTLVTIVNNSASLAIPSFKLKVKVTKSVEASINGVFHFHYVVVPLETTLDSNGNPVKGEPMYNYDNNTRYSCSNVPTGQDSSSLLGSKIWVVNDGEKNWTTHLFFDSVPYDGEFHDASKTGSTFVDSNCMILNPADCEVGFLDSSGGGFLPRQYFLDDYDEHYKKGDVKGITFRGEAYSTSYQYFRVYVWMDGGYTTTVVGDTISDPLQNAIIEVTWSENSILQQAPGESSPTETVGLYKNGSLVSSWDELIASGKITVNGSKITGSSQDLDGDLFIPSKINVIGDSAFAGNTNLSSVTLPVTMTTIENYAFSGCTSLSQLNFNGLTTQFNGVTLYASWKYGSSITKVNCIDGNVTF